MEATKPGTITAARKSPDLAAIPEQQWDLAKYRFEAIRPLLEHSTLDFEAIAQQARLCQVHRSTLYRWLAAYVRAPGLDSLLPHQRGRSRGTHQLVPEVEAIIESSVENRYLTPQRLSPIHVVRDVQLRCHEAGLAVPSESTVRRRLLEVCAQTRTRRREGARAAQACTPLRGHFPEVAHPLGVVQIDHTPLDLILVDDIHRRPIGKAWLTLAMDIFSRMVAGFSLAFEPPSSLSVRLCLTHDISPKDSWLILRGVSTVWPIDGLMVSVQWDISR
jgi:putative transposase